ncbi:hypothetical protein N0V88_005217 [Collariella sp. IMI 366227]|nr:hypothetical protein N0V88_005217 [Collariella sp. IMI 366227]
MQALEGAKGVFPTVHNPFEVTFPTITTRYSSTWGATPHQQKRQVNLDHSVDREVEKAQALANNVTLSRFSAKLKDNSAANLEHILKQQADAYPQLRRNLEQSARRKIAAKSQDSVPERTPEKSSDPQPKMGAFLIDGPIQIIHPLTKRIVEVAEMPDILPEEALQLAADLVLGINKAIEKGEILWELHGTAVVGLSPTEVVKIGTSLDPDEIMNLNYINTHVPAVPAPACLGVFTVMKRTYFFMSRAEGVELESLWPDLSVENKLSIQAQLNTILQALRNAPNPPNLDRDGPQKFGSFASAICRDNRREQRTNTVPIQTEAQFNDFLCHHSGRTVTPWIRMIRSAMRDNHRLVMTHGDIHPRNIMVAWEGGEEEDTGRGGEEKLRVTALIDWETSGWYPEYWEFVKAFSTIGMRGKMVSWLEYLPTEAIGTWPVELSVDSLLAQEMATTAYIAIYRVLDNRDPNHWAIFLNSPTHGDVILQVEDDKHGIGYYVAKPIYGKQPQRSVRHEASIDAGTISADNHDTAIALIQATPAWVMEALEGLVNVGMFEWRAGAKDEALGRRQDWQ